jgi:hypothetical protein
LHFTQSGSGGTFTRQDNSLVNFPASDSFKLDSQFLFPPTTVDQPAPSRQRRESRSSLRTRLWNATFPYVIGALLVFTPALGLLFLWKTPAYTKPAQVALSGLGIAGMFMQLAILHALRR